MKEEEATEGVASEQTTLIHFWETQMSADYISWSVIHKQRAKTLNCHSSSFEWCWFTVSGGWWRGVSSSQTPGFCSSQQDASGCRTLSGGRDEDAALFCRECCLDPEWDKPHVSVVYCWKLIPLLIRFETKHRLMFGLVLRSLIMFLNFLNTFQVAIFM